MKISLIWTLNIAFITVSTILGFTNLLYWIILMSVSIAIWFDHLGWQRGMATHQRIYNTIAKTLMRVMERQKNNEIRINNKDDFQKAFNEEMQLSKYYKEEKK